MAKCKECGREISPRRQLCDNCLDNWSKMRKQIWDYLTEKHGKFSYENQVIFKKETKRLEKIWRKDKNAFIKEIDRNVYPE